MGESIEPGKAAFAWVLLALLSLTAVRIAGLAFSAVDLFVDEAQYWDWSRQLAFGYFSKPPLLAWAIAATTSVCGHGEACVRLMSPLLYLATGLVIYAVARELYGPRVAGWSAPAFALGTGAVFSSRIVSTDVPLLLFWCLALLAYVHLLKMPDWRWAGLLGVSLGLGTLAKYAMLYFPLCVAVAAVLDRRARSLTMRPQTWAALGLGVLLLLPNLVWNLANDFITLRQTGDNVAGDGFRLRWAGAAEFFGAQLAVAGPAVFATFLFIVFRPAAPARPHDRIMLAFAVAPLIVVLVLSLVRGANANWAATSVPAMTILAVAWWLRHGWRRALGATIGLGLVVQVLLPVGDAFAYRMTLPGLGARGDLYARTLGWRALAEQAADLARANGAPTIAALGRAEVAALVYHLRDTPLRVVSWPARRTPDHHFDVTRPLDDLAPEPILFVGPRDYAPVLARRFRDVAAVGTVHVATGPMSTRSFAIYKLAGRAARSVRPSSSGSAATAKTFHPQTPPTDVRSSRSSGP